MYQHIAIIDFGSQFTQLIARKLRELGCYSEIIYPEDFIFSDEIKGIILSGSHKSVEDYAHYGNLLENIFSINKTKNIPILGICYGKQLICNFFGATVASGENREYGKAQLTLCADSQIVQNIDQNNFCVWMSHGDTVTSLPENFTKIASTQDCDFAIIEDEKRKIYCIQFHPEVSHTKFGQVILRNFIKICKLEGSWNLCVFSEDEKQKIIQQIHGSSVIAAVSGGVDSTVAAKFLHDAIDEKLICIFVDTGFLRKNEVKHVTEKFQKLGVPIKVIDGSSLFFRNLRDISDPEEKRKIIGRTFIEIFQEEAKKIKDAQFLLQGTLYPDIVESGHKTSNKIKSHHNVGGLPEKMYLKLIEPFKLLFKDEVRQIGRIMGIDEDILMHHPFPGPGLAVRILGELTEERVKILQDVDDIYISTMKEIGLYSKIWQAFAVLLPVRSTGVMGDKRSYNYVCALRAVTSSDGMTANAYPFESDSEDMTLFLNFLNKVAIKIPNQVKEVSRVVYDITSKPPATIEWE